jgi:hypothetical protein
VLDQARHEAVEQVGARDERPGVLVTEFQRRRDPLPALAGERPRERVAEYRILALGFTGAIHRHPARGVGDVPDQRLVHPLNYMRPLAPFRR